MMCWSLGREGHPLQGEGTVGDVLKWEETLPPLCNSHRESPLKCEINEQNELRKHDNIYPLGNRKE